MSIDTYMDHLSPARELLANASTLEEGLNAFFDCMTELYFDADPDAPMGCFLVGVVLNEAPGDPELRDVLKERLTMLNEMLFTAIAKRYPDAQPGDIQIAADQTSAVLHSLAVRVRSGEDKAILLKFTRQMVRVICCTLQRAEQ